MSSAAVDAALIPDCEPDPALLARLRDPELAARRQAVKDLAALPLAARGAWIGAAWVALDAEPDPDVAADLLRLLGTADRLGQVPLETHLDAGGPTMRRSATKSLFRAFDDATLFAAAFSGLLNPHRRSLASTLHEMATADGARVSSALTRCLYSQDAFIQRVGLVALLEVPEEVARPLLAQFPAELTLPDSASQKQEVESTFEMRKFLRAQSIAYFPLRQLGQGGMGAVWLSRDMKRPPRLAALKFMRKLDGRQDPELERRFEREARVPLLLNHPGLLRVFDFGHQPDLHWIDVDFIQGHNLQDLLDRVGTLDWTNVVWAAMQVADALDYLHRKRIIHRDLKPANLFIARDPHRVVLGDFGLVQIEDEQLQAEVPNYTPTQAHMILGTVGYMSPEQATSSPLDGRSDLFSLGCVMYRALAGKLPFPGRTFGEYMKAITSPQPPAALGADIPPQVADIVTTLIARAPEERFLNAAKLVDALRAVAQTGSGDPARTMAYATGGADPATLARSMGGSITGAPRRTGTHAALAAPSPQEPTMAAPAPDPMPAASLAGSPQPTSPPAPRTSGPTNVPAAGPVNPDTRGRLEKLNDAFVSGFKPVGAEVAPAPPSPPPPPAPVAAAPRIVEHPAPVITALPLKKSAPVAKPASKPKFELQPPPEQDPGGAGLRALPESRGWCPTCRAPTHSLVEGCLTCRYILMPWPPWILSWIFTALALWFVAPYALLLAQPYVPQAPQLRPPFGTRIICAAMGVGFYFIGRGLGRIANWAYVVGTLMTWTVGLAAGGAAYALQNATPDAVPPDLLPVLTRLGIVHEGTYTSELLLRVLREQFLGTLWVLGSASLFMGLMLLGGDTRAHFRRNWTILAILAALVSVALAVGAPAYMMYLRWNGLPVP
jgi:serine/threonine protein kinase